MKKIIQLACYGLQNVEKKRFFVSKYLQPFFVGNNNGDLWIGYLFAYKLISVRCAHKNPQTHHTDRNIRSNVC